MSKQSWSQRLTLMCPGPQLSSEHRHIVVAPTLPSIMRIGLVGKPNVGKSTAFSALTATPVDIADYPFTTIDPNVGIAWIPTPEPCRCKELVHRLGERIGVKKSLEQGASANLEQAHATIIVDWFQLPLSM